MELENQITSLEISKRLKELGVKQESYFMWDVLPDRVDLMKSVSSELMVKGLYSAFSVAELGEMLPEECITYKGGDLPWCCMYKKEEPKFHVYRERTDTEANARGKMLIYLLENKLLKGGE